MSTKSKTLILNDDAILTAVGKETANPKGPWFVQFGNAGRNIGAYATTKTLNFAMLCIAHCLNSDCITTEDPTEIKFHLQHLAELREAIDRATANDLPLSQHETDL